MTSTPTQRMSTETALAADPLNLPKRRVRRHRRSTVVRVTVLSVVLFAICLVWVYPFIWMVSASVKSNTEIFAGLGLFPKVVRLDNYIRAWTQGQIGTYFFNTVFITVFSIVISVTATAMIGYVLGRYRFAGKKVTIGLFAASVFLPEGYTIIPIFDLINKIHLSGSLWGITLAEAGGAHVVMVLLFAGYFSQLPAGGCQMVCVSGSVPNEGLEGTNHDQCDYSRDRCDQDRAGVAAGAACAGSGAG